MQTDTLTLKAQAAYQAASDHYDASALSFWDRFGRATIARLDLRPGAAVLDVCCGSGASALPAAVAVGPAGRVVGVDLARGLVERGRQKARWLGLGHVDFEVGNFLEREPEAETFDAVVCVFGIFFAADMPGAVRHLWRLVRPGGVLAITTWGPRVFEPANGIFWNAVRAERPELYKGFNPWDRISEPGAVQALLGEGGVTGASAVAESGWHRIPEPEDWWTIVLGSGYRGVVEQLTMAERDRVQSAVLREIAARQIDAIETNVIYASARKPER